ncbi:MAG: hypothetical protein KIT73_19245 [Burkholderiales bacterium]|nr:hypothetical protein [Burkholderiales bacterium]
MEIEKEFSQILTDARIVARNAAIEWLVDRILSKPGPVSSDLAPTLVLVELRAALERAQQDFQLMALPQLSSQESALMSAEVATSFHQVADYVRDLLNRRPGGQFVAAGPSA